jgi:hypothetical protein
MASEVKTNIISPATGTSVTFSGLNVGSDAAGDVLYNDGTDYTRLAKPGTPADEVLTFATGATAPSWVAPASATNAPAFAAYLSADQTIASSNTYTKVLCNTEIFDSDSKYDNSTDYRFLPQTAGKYYVTCHIQMYNSLGDNMSDLQIAIYKNGAKFKDARTVNGGHVYYSPGQVFPLNLSAIMDLNTTDYIELWGAQEEIAASTKYFAAGTLSTSFSAYKLIGI